VCYSFDRENGTPSDWGIATDKGNVTVTMNSTMNARFLAGAKCFGVEVIEDLEP
jgi:hypothetical protein